MDTSKIILLSLAFTFTEFSGRAFALAIHKRGKKMDTISFPYYFLPAENLYGCRLIADFSDWNRSISPSGVLRRNRGSPWLGNIRHACSQSQQTVFGEIAPSFIRSVCKRMSVILENSLRTARPLFRVRFSWIHFAKSLIPVEAPPLPIRWNMLIRQAWLLTEQLTGRLRMVQGINNMTTFLRNLKLLRFNRHGCAVLTWVKSELLCYRATLTNFWKNKRVEVCGLLDVYSAWSTTRNKFTKFNSVHHGRQWLHGPSTFRAKWISNPIHSAVIVNKLNCRYVVGSIDDFIPTTYRPHTDHAIDCDIGCVGANGN